MCRYRVASGARFAPMGDEPERTRWFDDPEFLGAPWLQPVLFGVLAAWFAVATYVAVIIEDPYVISTIMVPTVALWWVRRMNLG